MICLTWASIALFAVFDNIPEGQPLDLGGRELDNALQFILSKLSAEAMA